MYYLYAGIEYAVVFYSSKWKELDQDEDPKTKPVAGELARVTIFYSW